MEELGYLWQTDTITPAHEHFVTHLIKQKLLFETEKLQIKEPTNLDKTFVLYLPMNEIHELGLLYLNYEVLDKGFKTIYLSESVPSSSLVDLKKYFKNLVFVTYITVEPVRENVNAYVDELKDLLIENQTDDTELWFLGRMTEYIKPKDDFRIKIFNDIKQFSRYL